MLGNAVYITRQIKYHEFLSREIFLNWLLLLLNISERIFVLFPETMPYC